MRYSKLVGLLLLFVNLNVKAQQIDTSILKSQAVIMSNAFSSGDWKTLVKYTYPKVVDMMGGEDNMINYLNSFTEKLKGQGISYKSVEVGLTQNFLKAGDEIHTLVSQALILKVPGGTLSSSSYLLAITKDGGQNWFFTDTAPFSDKEKLKQVFPNFNEELKIPAKDPPVFTKEE